jgi:DNA-binding transcriptional LysR family regulator
MKIPAFEIYRLVVFYYVAKEKSMTEAANKLFITQPAVTSHIKILEKLIGLQLIEIKKQRITLTHAGEVIYQYAKEIYDQSILAGRFIDLMRTSSLHIGITPLFNSIVVHLLSTLFDELYPQVNIMVESKASHYLINDVLDSTIDLAIVTGQRQIDSKLNYLSLMDGIKPIFYTSPNNPIFNKHRITWKDLSRYPLIVGSEKSIVKQHIIEKLRAAKINIDLIKGPSISSDYELNKRLAKYGNFICTTLRTNIEEELKKGELRIVNLPDEFTIGAGLVFYPSTTASPMIRKIISKIKDTFNSYKLNYLNEN